MSVSTTPLPPPTATDHGAQPRPVEALMLPMRLFLAAGWLRAGVEKVIDPSWWTGDVLAEFLRQQQPHMLPFFRWFSDLSIAPLTLPVAWIVAEVQIAIGLCLLLNRAPRQALWAGVVLNVCFTLAGRVNPSAFYLVMELVLLAALSRPVNMTIAWRRAALWGVPALLLLPFARTLEPAGVIDDPALMLSFASALAAVVTLAWSAAHLRFRVGLLHLLPRTAWSEVVQTRLQKFITPSPRSSGSDPSSW